MNEQDRERDIHRGVSADREQMRLIFQAVDVKPVKQIGQGEQFLVGRYCESSA